MKGFGAEAREESRIAGITELWRKATITTWSRFTNLWLVHSLLLVGLQAGLTGLLVREWAHGRATAGGVAFAITAFMLMTGYLRNIGDNIRMAQRGLDDSEDVARYARMTPEVLDAPAAPAFRADLGEIVFDRTFRQVGGVALYDRFTSAHRARRAGGAGRTDRVRQVDLREVRLRLYDAV